MTGHLLSSTAFALLAICPQSAGITNIIASATHLNITMIAFLTTVPTLPLNILIALIFRECGLFCCTSLLCCDRSHDCGRYEVNQLQCWRGNAYHDVILDSGYKGCLYGLNVGELKCS